MTINLKLINVEQYQDERDTIFALLEQIWTRQESLDNVKHSVDRWGTSQTESGTYFYIMRGNEPIGITGYFIPSLETGDFGLRHHGTTVRGTGRAALDSLCGYLQESYGSSFQRMIELIPQGREELIDRFAKWGFELSSDPVPAWESKKDYYKYVMVREH